MVIPPAVAVTVALLTGAAAGVALEKGGALDPVGEPKGKVTVTRDDQVPVFACPGDVIAITTLSRGDRVLATGRTRDGDFLEIRSPLDLAAAAWIASDVMVGDDGSTAADDLPTATCDREPIPTTTSTSTTIAETTTSSSTTSTTAATTSTTRPTTTTTVPGGIVNLTNTPPETPQCSVPLTATTFGPVDSVSVVANDPAPQGTFTGGFNGTMTLTGPNTWELSTAPYDSPGTFQDVTFTATAFVGQTAVGSDSVQVTYSLNCTG